MMTLGNTALVLCGLVKVDVGETAGLKDQLRNTTEFNSNFKRIILVI